MRKIILLVSVIVSLWASPESDMLGDHSKATRDFKVHVFSVLDKQDELNEQTSEALLKQLSFNSTQNEINSTYRINIKNLYQELSEVRAKLSYVNVSSQGQDTRHLTLKLKGLEDTFYRIERMLSQQDERLRAVERRAK